MRFRILTLTAAVAVSGVMLSDAQAQRRGRAEPPPLTVYKRSYLEPSNQVPVGSYNAYVVQSTVLGAPFVARDIFHDRIGESNLPTRFFAPGWTGPQFAPFYTGAY